MKALNKTMLKEQMPIISRTCNFLQKFSPFYNVDQCKDVYTFKPCKTKLDYAFVSVSLKIDHLVDYDISSEGEISNTSDHLPVIA